MLFVIQTFVSDIGKISMNHFIWAMFMSHYKSRHTMSFMSRNDSISIHQPLHQQLLGSCIHFSWYQYRSKDDQLGFSMHQVFCIQWALCWTMILIWVISNIWLTNLFRTASVDCLQSFPSLLSCDSGIFFFPPFVFPAKSSASAAAISKKICWN